MQGGAEAAVNYAIGGRHVTARTKQAKFYQMRAIQVLGVTLDSRTPKAYRWIWPAPEPGTEDNRPRWTILAELGRIDDDKTLRSVAAQVCKAKMKTAEALRALRRMRTGKRKPGDTLELANVIVDVINDYTSRRPGLSPDDIRKALRTVEGLIND
jgi:hypothetical protein